ncbi:MAG TPA: acyl-CoA dehydrogenase family protein [Dehalococcoidia bacterium]|nr:acyl-CoA dehydrogenase family protein [Dehalococcoidia bacterium]
MAPYDHLANPRVLMVAQDAAARIEQRVAAGASGHELLAQCVADLRESGYLATIVPERLGGLGATILDVCVAQERIAAALGSAGLAANMHVMYIGNALVSRLWPADMLDRFLRGVVEHGWFINNCQAEPEMGSPARGGLFATTATRVDGGWRIDGRKSWSTGAPFLTHIGVGATVRAAGVPEHVGQFLVEMRTPGIRIEENWDGLAMRESASHDIVFDGAFVPDADVIRVSPTGEKYTPPLETSPWHGLPWAATYTGVAVAARDWVAGYAATRVPTNLGKPIGDLPGVRAKLGEIEALLMTSRRLIAGTARDWVEDRMDRGELAAQVGLVKSIATNNAVRITDLALRIAGAAGLAQRNTLERCFRDARSGLIHPPLDDVALEAAAVRAMRPYREG